MNKNVKGTITVLAAVGITVAVIQLALSNKKKYAKTVARLNGTTASYPKLLTMEEGYLRSWARALSKAKSSFFYNNENYYSEGGKKIVS